MPRLTSAERSRQGSWWLISANPRNLVIHTRVYPSAQMQMVGMECFCYTIPFIHTWTRPSSTSKSPFEVTSSALKCHLRMSGASSHMMSFVSLSSLRVTSFARLVTLMVYSSRGVDQQLEAGVRRGACPASIFRRRPSLVHLLNHAQSLLVLRVHANARPWYRIRETKRNVGYCQSPYDTER